MTDIQSVFLSNFGNGYLVLLDFTAATKTFATGDVDTANDRIDLSGMTPTPVAGTQVYFTGLSATTDFANSQRYWLVDNSGTSWGLAATPGGTKIDITAAVSGTITEAPPAGSVGGVYRKADYFTVLARHEVASYEEMSTRPSWTAPGAFTQVTVAAGNTSEVLEEDGTAPPTTVEGFGFTGAQSSVTFTNTTAITFNYAVLIKGGTSARGNTTGTIQPSPNGGAVFGDGTSNTVFSITVRLPMFFAANAPS